MIFPYQQNEQDYYPLIKVSLIFGNQKVVLEALIDSGANISVFNEELAELLGINVEKGKKTYLGGVGGRIMGYIHILKIETADKIFSCPVVFSREFKVSFNLIGRQGFFEKFVISFDERNRQVALE